MESKPLLESKELDDPSTPVVVNPLLREQFVLVFGGQGYAYLDELRAVSQLPEGSLANRVVEVGMQALVDEESLAIERGFHFHIRFPFSSRWVLDSNVTQPSNVHVFSSPCSYPLIFLAQIANYANALDRLGESIESVLKRIAGGSGHSQGVVASYLVAISPSNDALLSNLERLIKCMFWLGLVAHVPHSLKLGAALDVVSSPLLAVSGLGEQELAQTMAITMKRLDQLQQTKMKAGSSPPTTVTSMYIALVNGRKSLVVAGEPDTLEALKDDLGKVSAPLASQTRIPFSIRKPEVGCTFLRVSSPFHCPLNASQVGLVQTEWDRLLGGDETFVQAFPVLSTVDGRPVSTATQLVKMQCCDKLDFPAVAKGLRALASKAIELGTGSGASKLLAQELEGSGLLVITSRCTDLKGEQEMAQGSASSHSPTNSVVTMRYYLDCLAKGRAVEGPNWEAEYSPSLVYSEAAQKYVVNTKFTKMIMRPPLVMAGMTPTTGFHGINLVTACTKAGYIGEIAGGGLPLPDYFQSKLQELNAKNANGSGINVNMLYLNAHQWGFQFPLCLELARAGIPLESVTIAAGVPTSDKAPDILSELSKCGVRYVSLKPGNTQSILDCLLIATEAEKHHMFVVIQWTGGRGGGHHSFEDFHEPLLNTYAAIRKQSNVVLVVGSGFGDAEGSFPYLTGQWSESFGRPKMPCDGILMGSRCMVALEAATSLRVKELIIATPGVNNDRDWERSYDTDAGGVITLTSELGEPIHKIGNRGMRCWRDFDRKYFSVERGPKRLEAIMKDKDEIVSRLNKDSQKVFFGMKYGLPERRPCDLAEMTYVEVLKRMVELMYVTNGSSPQFEKDRWIDVTYQTRTFTFLVRAERRFRRDASLPTVGDDVAKLRVDPANLVFAFEETYPAAARTLLASDDVSYFIDLCKDQKNGKPVNFVPVIDADLDFWVKKDSLWYSEDLDAVPDRDPERVCILQGPVAVKHSTKVNEPIADIMNDVHDGWVDLLKARETTVGSERQAARLESLSTLNDAFQSRVEQEFPWIKNTASNSWQRIVLSRKSRVVRDKLWTENVIPELFGVAQAEGYDIEIGDDFIRSKNVELCRLDSSRLLLTVRYGSETKAVSIQFKFQPHVAIAPLVQESSNTKSFYEQVWLGASANSSVTGPWSIHDSHSSEYILRESDVKTFNQAIRQVDPLTDLAFAEPSLDIAIVCGWEPLIKNLFARELDERTCDLLQLVHLSHSYRLLTTPQRQQSMSLKESANNISVGDVVRTKTRVVSVDIIKGVGKKISCCGILSRKRRDPAEQDNDKESEEPWVEITSTFLIRGSFADYSNCFFSGPASGKNEESVVHIKTSSDLEVLLSKPWFSPIVANNDIDDHKLVFVLDTLFERKSSENFFAQITVKGKVYKHEDRTKLIGLVAFDSGDSLLKENPVLAYLRRKRESPENGKLLESAGATVLEVPEIIYVPENPQTFAYGKASKDTNPIHSSRYFAALARLPQSRPIVHGMWTCAIARRIVEKGVAQGDASRIYKFEVEFVGMVQFGETLASQITFLGVVSGRMVMRIEIKSVQSNQIVLRGRAEVEQARTAYLFTGQGSASVGMGLDRYEAVESVRKVWDRADSHLQNKYGFSILDIVKNNPKELTIHFGGPLGRQLRENYRNIRVSTAVSGEMVQLLPEVLQDTKSFTFKASSEGLLFATQFAQPALVIVQKAAFQELQDNGLVPLNSCFAGHSLGEYAGLASFADVLTVEDLVETVFLRGMVMQNAVPRDAKGRSEFGMVAVNPGRVKSGTKKFTADHLLALVDVLSQKSQLLLQVVNFNVRDTQYVVAGHLIALDALSVCLASGDQSLAAIAQALDRSRERWSMSKDADLSFDLERGAATIPLVGIDVPFHSRQLLPGVPAFRELLEPRLSLDRVAKVIGRLVNKYIPNVTAKYFSLDVDYIELTANATGSKALFDLLGEMKSSFSVGKVIDDASIARTLLIELLAHQFAMPVLWIDTQDSIFLEGTKRLIEMGPAPTLVGMAQRTLASGVFGKQESPPEILWWGRDMATITYSAVEDKGPALDVFVANLQQANNTASPSLSDTDDEESAVVATTVRATPPVSQQVIAPVASAIVPSDHPVSAMHSIRVLLASKLKRPLSEIKEEATLKSLSQGKSAIQNEIVGDLSSEFNLSLDTSAVESPIVELASTATKTYKHHGKVTTQFIAKTLSAKLPGSFAPSATRAYLTSAKGFGPSMVEAVLLHACGCQAPPSRLTSVDEVKIWLDEATVACAKEMNITLSAPLPMGASIANVPSLMMDNSPSVAIPDVSPTPMHSVKVILATKLKVALSDVKDGSSLKSLSQGKSAVQNEIVGDLQAEFPGMDFSNAAEVALAELMTKVSAATYSQLGKTCSGLVSRTLVSRLPGDFPLSMVKEYLGGKGLGPGLIDSILLHSTTMAPNSRLPNANETKIWLDAVIDSFASYSGLHLKRQSTGGGASVRLNASHAIDSEALTAHQKRVADLLLAQVEAFEVYLSKPVSSAPKSGNASRLTQNDEAALELLDMMKQELGDKFMEGIRPVHDPLKVREYDSFWNWVVQDALELHLHVLATVRRMKGEAEISIPNANNQHFEAMANWIAAVASGNTNHEPPQAWFRNFLCNRATKELLIAVEFFAIAMSRQGQSEYAQLITLLAEQVEAWVDRAPVLVARAVHDAPQTLISTQGAVEYREHPRDKVDDCVQYVEELACGAFYAKDNLDVIFDTSAVPNPSQIRLLETLDVPLTSPSEDGTTHDLLLTAATEREEDRASIKDRPESVNSRRKDRPSGPILEAMRDSVLRHGADVSLQLRSIPLVHLKSPSTTDPSLREYDPVKTAMYLSCLHAISTQGVSFAGQICLVTGGGIGSIAVEVVKLLLEGGATVISAINYTKSTDAIQDTLKEYRKIYEEHGSKGSRLITEPCNVGSSQDVDRLIRHIYDNLALDLDYIVPFAALAERGRDISSIDSESELAHRAMLTNVVRLLGKVKDAKTSRSIRTRPAMVLLPCSPNHGVFGNDGLYAESKLGIEALVNKWKSEAWQDYLSLSACVIGWTRSALMWQNNVVAEAIEALGCRTFSTSEMAVNLVALMHPRMVIAACDQPIWADLTGGWQKVPDLESAVKSIRQRIQDKANVAKFLAKEKSLDSLSYVESRVVPLLTSERGNTDYDRQWMKKAAIFSSDVPLANPSGQMKFPTLPTPNQLKSAILENIVDLERIICIVGYGEVGPWGNSRTRWEMEAYGEFSLEGCIELAWLMGLIQHHDGPMPSNPRARYVGWVDSATKEPVHDHDVKRRYEEFMLSHCGIRVLEPELFEGYNPKAKRVWTRVGVERDMPFVEAASREHALEIQEAVGGEGKCDIVEVDGSLKVKVRAGAIIAVPRTFEFSRFVVGQIPTGWSAERLGVPAEIAKAVDPVTLFALVSTMEAFCAAGVCDPYELYSYVHVSQVGNTSGGGMGGMRSLKRMFADRVLDDPEVPSDTLAESFINTMPAWVNMLLVSSSGPIKTPVGACATAAESVEIGMETILSGKARVVIVGGYDDFGETGSYEFAQMGATQDNSKDRDRGRPAAEASRPMTSSRSGFVESHGAGMQILMDARLAIEMGCPIYGIVALTNTATDREGRSIPAPGRGILTTARETIQYSDSDSKVRKRSKMLDIQFRRQRIAEELKAIDEWEAVQMGGDEDEAQLISKLAQRKRAGVFETWGQGFYKGFSSEISPLSGALSVWGLSVDDIDVVSCHGTSTTLNDKNESSVVNKQFEHLGRSPGNICLVVAQKWLTAHPKGAAAAWMLNGALQMLNTAIVPGNRNLDNCSQELRTFPYLFYPNRSIHLAQVRAVLLKSFGFGQAGAEILLVHPDRLLASLSDAAYQTYVDRRAQREQRTFRYYQNVMSGKHGLIRVKTRAPYLPDQEAAVYLNPDARASYDEKEGTWVFKRTFAEDALFKLKSGRNAVDTRETFSKPTVAEPTTAAIIPAETRLKIMLQEQAEGLTMSGSGKGIGVDVEQVSTFKDLTQRQEFIERNFTIEEISRCSEASDPSASFAGRWAAKEAVVKAISSVSPDARSLWSGAHAPLIGIEVLLSQSGAPVVILHGHPKEVAAALGIAEIKVSISHTGDVAVAQAIAISV